MADLTEEQQAIVSRLQAEHEDVQSYYIKRAGEFVVVRKCKPAERARFVDRISKKEKEPMNVAMKEMTLSCVVYPEDRAEAKALLERYPALYDKFAQKAYELAEGDVEELGKD